jgi:hypothetical protein
MAVQKTIGGRAYTFSRCSTVEALDLELSLAKVGAESVATMDLQALFSLLGDDGKLQAQFGLEIAGVLAGIAQKLTHAELTRLMGIVFQYVDIDGKTIGGEKSDLNKAFADRPRDIWQAFLEALSVNLGPLGEGLVAKLKKAAEKPDETAK